MWNDPFMPFSRKNFAVARIFYDEMNHRVFTEVPSYTFAQLSADFGGILAIILGCSVISFMEFIFCIIGLIVYAVNQGKISIL